MGAIVTDYDWKRDALLISSPVVPSRIRLSKPDSRGREVYTAQVFEYVRKDAFDDVMCRLGEHDHFIRYLCQFVPRHKRKHVMQQMSDMGIDYKGADEL